MWQSNIKVGCAYSKSECWGTGDIQQGYYLYVCAYNNGGPLSEFTRKSGWLLG